MISLSSSAGELEAFDLGQVTLARIEELEGQMLARADGITELPVDHLFAPGVYIRQIFMPAGLLVIGHEHVTAHFNIILEGRAAVLMDGQQHDIQAPATIVSEVGVRKLLVILEDMIWQTVHVNPDDCRDVATLEARFVKKSRTYLAFEARRRLESAARAVLQSASSVL